MGLKEYKAKRRFDNTPEPEGKEARSRKELKFVIQKHAASHLHYDFRLEMDGVLKSWAVPKGPSLNPEDKRLAMMVEDHPMDYRSFEGIIPKGNYGAGTVMVWDEGTYTAEPGLSAKESEKRLLKGLEEGKLTFTMSGKKLRGEFALVKINGGKYGDKGNSWLLIKHQDEFASDEDIRHRNTSAVSDRTLEEIRADESRDGGNQWHSNREEEDTGVDRGEDGTLRRWDRDFEGPAPRGRKGGSRKPAAKKKRPT